MKKLFPESDSYCWLAALAVFASQVFFILLAPPSHLLWIIPKGVRGECLECEWCMLWM